MSGTTHQTADASVLDEHEAAIMLLALSGSKTRVPITQLLQLLELQREVATQLEVVNRRLRNSMMQSMSRMDEKSKGYRAQRRALEREKIALEAQVVALEAEGRFWANYSE
jgi:hypothetical protein